MMVFNCVNFTIGMLLKFIVLFILVTGANIEQSNVYKLRASESWQNEMCFMCADSSSKGDCQDNTGRMEELHTKLISEYGGNEVNFLQDYKDDPYVQNCTALTGHQYCCVEEFESNGNIKAYIRTCCDGKSWSFNPDKLELLKNVQPNNDSRCQFDSQTSTTTCITMCQGNFCNGPTAGGRIPLFSSVLLVIHVILVYCLS